MGLYDTGIVICPHCNKPTEEQTKDLHSLLDYYDLNDYVSPHVAIAFEGRWECDNCGENFYVSTPFINKIKVTVSKTKHEDDEND